MVTPPRGDRAGAKPHGVASPHTPRVIRAREGVVNAPPARVGAARARSDARIALALFSVSLLWCSSLSASETLVDLFLPPAARPTDAAVVADAASLLVAHAARAERDLVACAERQTRACLQNVRLDANAESRRADDVAARNDAAAELAAAVSETCVALDARVGDALRVVAARRAPEDLLWKTTRFEENAANAASADAASALRCSSRDRAATRAVAEVAASAERTVRADANASTSESSYSSMSDVLSNVSATYRVAAETYRAEAEAAIDAAASVVTSRAAYDLAYAANKTSALAAARAALEHNVTTELVSVVHVASEALGALDADAGVRLRAVASDAASALADTRDEVQAAARTHVSATRAYVLDVSAQLAEAKAWFDAFAGIGSAVKTMLGGLATALPSIDAPAPPALRLAELSPQVVPNVSGAVAVAAASAEAGADALAAATDAARLRLAGAAVRVPAAFESPALEVFTDYDPPPRETKAEGSAADDPGGARAATAFAAAVRGDADARWSRFSVAVAAAESAVDAARESLNASRVSKNETIETFEREVAHLEDEVASSVSEADVAGDVASFAAASAERLDAAGSDASSAAAGTAEWLGVAGPDVGAWRTAVSAATAAADGLVGADLAYRFARSFQLVARHFEGSKRGRLPPVDLTVGAAAAAAAASQGSHPRKSALMSAAVAIGHPACQAVVRVSAVGLVTALVTNAYLPFRDAYRRGCVSGRGGTFATKNARALAHNYAAASASRVFEAGNAQVERERRNACASSAPASAARLKRAEARVSAAVADARRAAEATRRVQRCVDADALLSEAAGRSLVSEPRPANATNATVSAPSAWEAAARTLVEIEPEVLRACLDVDDAFALDDGALFDCAALGDCGAARCGGPRQEVLDPLAFAAGCLAEGIAHASLLRTALVVAVFLAANATRETAVEGAAALCWRALAGDSGVAFRGTLALDGAMEVSNDPKRAARAKLAQTARAHEMRGVAKMALAAAAQVPGLVALWFARRASLAPDFGCVA